jgi:hypothetical protein
MFLKPAGCKCAKCLERRRKAQWFPPDRPVRHRPPRDHRAINRFPGSPPAGRSSPVSRSRRSLNARSIAAILDEMLSYRRRRCRARSGSRWRNGLCRRWRRISRRELVAAALQALQRCQIPSNCGRTCPCQSIGVWFLQRSRILCWMP